jgi:DNA recombination protein RmuC
MKEQTMAVALLVVASVAALSAAAVAILAYRRVDHLARKPTDEQLCSQTDRILQFSDRQSRNLREEIGGAMRGFQDSTLKAFRELGDALATRMNEFGFRMDAGVKAIDDRAVAIAGKLNHDIVQMQEEAGRDRDTLRQIIEVKLDDAATKHATTAKESRQEMVANFQHLGGVVTNTIGQLGVQQKERLDNVSLALGKLVETQERAQEALRHSVEQRLDAIRNENAGKLEELRKTVDEKLQTTLEARLGESFNRVVEQLERVHKGIGEMQSLAAGVGDLKKVLSNVRVRGAFGELQLGTLLEQFLSPEQISRTRRSGRIVKKGSNSPLGCRAAMRMERSSYR